jgi:RNA polymerase sigma-70 factor (ECF subfamily)
MGLMVDQLVATGGASAALGDFPALFMAEQRRVFLLCQRMLNDSDEAGSATQDVFFKAFRALQAKDEPIDDLSRWLTRIAVNTCLDRLRSRRWQFWRKRPNPEDEEIILAMAPAAAPDAEDHVFATQIGRRLREALARLSGRQRAVFLLRHCEDRSLEEIAGILGLDVGTVKAHMARAVARLRRELEDLYALRKR